MTTNTARTAFLFDLDGTLVDSVYQHVLAWREALEAGGIRLSVEIASSLAESIWVSGSIPSSAGSGYSGRLSFTVTPFVYR